MPIWKEATFPNPNKYNVTDNLDGTKTIVSNFGSQTNDAVPLSPEQLNKLEERTVQFCGVSTGTSTQYTITLSETSKPLNGTAYKFVAHVNNSANATIKITGLDGNDYTYYIYCDGDKIGSDVIKANTMVCFAYYNDKVHLINGVENKKVGDIIYSATPITDTKYLPCDGRSLDKTNYSSLFSKIGYDYGMDLQFINTTTNVYTDWATDGTKIIGMSNNALYSSIDGINYSKITTSGTIEGTYNAIFYEKSLWFLSTYYTVSSSSYSNHRLYKSSDGITWTKILDGAKGGNYKISSNSSGWVILEHFYNSKYYCKAHYSTDGSTWTQISNQENLDCGKSRFIEYNIIPFNNYFVIFQNDNYDDYSNIYKVTLNNAAFVDLGRFDYLQNVITLNDELYVFTRECTYKSTDGSVWNVLPGIRPVGQSLSNSSIYKTKYNIYRSEPYEWYNGTFSEVKTSSRYMVTGKDLMNWRYIAPDSVSFDQIEFKGKIYSKGTSTIQYSLMNYFYLPVIPNGYIKVVD